MCYSPQVVVAVALVLVLCFEYANSFAQIHTISSRTRTSRSSNSVRSIPTANGLASGRHPFARHPLHYLQPRRRGLQLHASAYDSLWSAAAVPGGYDAVEDLLAKSLDRALDQLGPATDTGSSNSRRRLSVDLLTPGLNPKLEQKAILLQPYLFDLVIATFPVLNLKFSNVRLAFESTGDAAGFQSYCYSNGVEIPESFSLSEINREYMSNRIDCVLVVSAKNNVGNPVIRELQFLCESMASATFVFLNCDLSDKVATGMTDKTVRDNFRTSIRPAFYFRNIVLMSRPTLVPTEVGVLLYTPNSGWKVFAVNDEDVSGPGSLNRFMKQATFQRSPRDPTPTNPPRFAKIASYEEMPKKEEIGQIMSRAAFLNAKYEREKARAESVGLSSSSSGERIAIDSVATALQVLNYTINGNRDGKPVDIVQAVLFLQENFRKSSTNSSIDSATSSTASDAGVTEAAVTTVSTIPAAQRMSMLDLSEESSELSSQTFSTSLRNLSPQTMSQQSFSSSVSQYDEVDDTRFEELVLDRQLKKVLSFDVTDIQAQLLSNPAEAANLRIQYSAGGEEKMFLGSGGEFRRETTAMGICTASSAGSYEIQGSLRPTIELKTVSLSYMNGLMKTTPVTKKDAISRQLIAFVDKSIVVLRESDQDSGQLKYGLWKLA